jgi:tetratricopeptide (TPR) repeat protein
LADVIAGYKKRYEANPNDIDLLGKLVNALSESEKPEDEEEAIKILVEAYKRTDQYRLKLRAGDIRIKQYTRRLRRLKRELEDTGDDEARRQQLLKQAKELANEQLGFELEEYSERVKNYPTDMGYRFQLGRRQFALGDDDAAISSFQEAQKDPKSRALTLRYLGEAFHRKGWFDESIDTLRRAIEMHPSTDDKLALELRYELLKSLASKAENVRDLSIAEEASKVASHIAQTDINFKDIRARIDKLRKFMDELRRGAASGAV